MGSIFCRIFDANLLSGSGDTFRTANGGYWEAVETEYGSQYKLKETDASNPAYSTFKKIFFSSEQETIDDTIMVPNKKVAIRIAGDTEMIKSDGYWRTLMLGGTYGENTYSTIYNELIFQNFNFKYNMPYPKISASAMADSYSATDVVQVSYDYWDYLPKYENYINDYVSELLIPNYYIMADLAGEDFVTNTESMDLYPPELLRYVSLEDQYPFVNELFDFNGDMQPTPVPQWKLDMFDEVRKRNTNLSIQYLTSSLVQNSLSASTIDWVESKLQTMLFDEEAIEKFSTMDDYEDCLPYRVQITFPAFTSDVANALDTAAAEEDAVDAGDPGTPPAEYTAAELLSTYMPFLDSIGSNDFTQKFLKILYETFDNKIDDFTPTSRAYAKVSEYYSGSTATFVEDIAGETYREIDYVKFLAYCYNNYTNDNKDYMFVGGNNINRLAATENNATYRHVNTKAAAGVLNDAIDYLQDLDVTKWKRLYSGRTGHSETVAYRIEKIGGAPTGDSATQNVLQNYWFINSADMVDFEFFDSQIKFDSDYTYNIYAYVLVTGYKYNFSDLRLTRQLGCADSEEEDARVGLEFYDPFTADDDTIDELYDSSNDMRDFTPLENTYATDAQVFSSYDYLADFYLNYEPTIKIVEMPIYSKTLRVLDNPPNVLNVVPYQAVDSSQRVGFDFAYNVFSKTTFPSVISEDDELYKQRYMNGHDLLEDTIVTQATVSQPRYIEVYRLSERPTAVTDFDGSLRATLDLKIKNESEYTQKSANYIEAVQANRKYYYLFRVLNQRRNLSHLSETYEVELINDGGYIYAIFNVLSESDLEQEVFTKTSKEFKKIFQLQPNLSQLQFNTEKVNFNESAGSQIDNLVVGTADDLIWDKTFKIRLTSKKTGRKIDLNITYNLNS